MVAVFTVIGYICCILLVGLIITTSFKFLKCCFQNDVVMQARDHKNNIYTSLYEAKKEGYKIMFRTPDCNSYENYAIHIAYQGDEEIIVIDLYK